MKYLLRKCVAAHRGDFPFCAGRKFHSPSGLFSFVSIASANTAEGVKDNLLAADCRMWMKQNASLTFWRGRLKCPPLKISECSLYAGDFWDSDCSVKNGLYKENSRIMDMKKWFKEAQYGMMVHWGLYSLLAGEWRGRFCGPYAEWIQANLAIPNAEYEQLAKAFNPVCFDADAWVRLAKACGMQYFVVTGKHHDGFAMFHSKVDRYNVVDATPFGRDVMAELGEACYKHGLKLGMYYSQDLDWHEEHGGGYLSDPATAQGVTWENSWDFPDKSKKNFDICFENKIYPQVEEILRNYGELCLIWFDMPMTLREDQSRRIYEAVKRYQPECLINSRLGNGAYDYVSLGDNEIPSEIPPATRCARRR